MGFRVAAIAAAALAVAGAALLLAPDVAGKDGAPRIPHDDPARVAEGAGLYATHCAACHGADLEGQPDWRTPLLSGRLPAPPHDETGHTWHHADALLFRITKEGSAAVVGGGYESDMAGFGDILTDAEILSVLAYIKSTWPAEVVDVHDGINAAAGDG